MLTQHLKNLEALGVSRQEIGLVGGDKNYTSWYHRHPLSQCIPSSLFVKVPSRSSGLLVTGGGTINTRDGRGLSLRRIKRLVDLFLQQKLPVFVSGQTIGPLGINKEHDKLAKQLVQRVDVLTVRDTSYSLEYLKKIGAKPKVFVETTDDAVALEYQDEDISQPLKDFFVNSDVAAVNITRYTSDTDSKKALIASLILWLQAEGYKVVLVPHAPEDLQKFKSIISALGTILNQEKCFLLDTTWWRAEQVKKVISCCKLAVGGRYHFVVFALTAGIPCVGMTGNHYSWIKQHGFAVQMGLGSCILDPHRVGNLEEIIKLITKTKKLHATVVPESRSFAMVKEWLFHRV
jgi:colanic acid/amylovoran biosynthesis protein